MNTYDFTSVPVMGKIMSITGITDGWVIISIALLILAVIFLVAWISSASRGRAARKELSKLKEEVVGLQALTTLPPLHEIDWEQAEGRDPGSSLVFASTKELKRRREKDSRKAVPQAEAEQAPQSASEAEQPAAKKQPAVSANAAADSVTAQVHEAIFASVTSGHLKKADDNRQAAKISSEDLPPIHVERKKTAAKPQTAKPEANSDASLSSRIPRL